MESTPVSTPTSVSRRTVVKGTAWAAPAVALATSLPAFASSPIDLEPGLNGWVNVSAGTCRGGKMTFTVTTPTDVRARQRDFGLFVWNGSKDANGNPVQLPQSEVSNVSFIFWVNGQSVDAPALSRNSANKGWRFAGNVTGNSGGENYVGLRFTYSGGFTPVGDRLYVAPLDFTVRATLGSRWCPRDMNTIAERHVTVAGSNLSLARILHFHASGGTWRPESNIGTPVRPILGSGHTGTSKPDTSKPDTTDGNHLEKVAGSDDGKKTSVA